VYDERYQIGGLTFLAAFNDLLISKEANDTAAEFMRSKIRKIIKDPATAETLTPYGYPIGSKRMCVDNQYYETYNRDNVTLVDLRKENIEEIIPVGIKTTKMTYEVDSIVFATGFDAMTGPLLSIDIRGRSDYSLREKWAAGPHTYLGMMTADFPNLFLITGPGSPSVLTNMVISIEHDVDWIAECLDYLRKYDFDSIEATLEAEDAWVNHVNEIANATLFPIANSWYMGANIPGKPRVFMPYAGGLLPYLQKCKSVATNGYEGFRCIQRQSVTSITAN
jgi:cyclohexanone monooxygenase